MALAESCTKTRMSERQFFVALPTQEFTVLACVPKEISWQISHWSVRLGFDPSAPGCALRLPGDILSVILPPVDVEGVGAGCFFA